jgi:hypothetical protein
VTLVGGPAGSGKATLMREAVKAVATLGYLGQEDREIGFRTFFREKAPEFKVLEPLVCRDDPGIASSNKNR